MDLNATLGLNEVDSNPNKIPVGEVVPGTVFKSEYRKSAGKDGKPDRLSHVFTYKVTAGKHEGKQQDEWIAIGEPKYDENQQLVGVAPNMSEKAKAFYKGRLEALGVTPEQMSNFNPGQLIGLDVNFSVRMNNGFQNLATVELRNGGVDVTNAPDFVQGAVSGEQPQQTPTQSTEDLLKNL